MFTGTSISNAGTFVVYKTKLLYGRKRSKPRHGDACPEIVTRHKGARDGYTENVARAYRRTAYGRRLLENGSCGRKTTGVNRMGITVIPGARRAGGSSFRRVPRVWSAVFAITSRYKGMRRF